MPFQLTTDLSVVETSKVTKEKTQAHKSTLRTTILAGQIQHVQKISEQATDKKPYFRQKLLTDQMDTEDEDGTQCEKCCQGETVSSSQG